jgi:hypothetical protein
VEVQIEEHETQEDHDAYQECEHESSYIARRFFRSDCLWFAIIVYRHFKPLNVRCTPVARGTALIFLGEGGSLSSICDLVGVDADVVDKEFCGEFCGGVGGFGPVAAYGEVE